MGIVSTSLRNDRVVSHEPAHGSRSRTLEIYVLFTDVPATLGALRTAAQLADGLPSRLRLLLLETVPYPLPLDQPARNMQFLARRFRTLVENNWAETPRRWIETKVDVMLCRDPWQGIEQKLLPGSVIVIGQRRRWQWWPSPEDRLARRLNAAGHHVVRAAEVTKGETHHA